MPPVSIAELAVRITAEGIEPAQRALRGVDDAGKSVAKGLQGTGSTVQSLIFSFNGLAAQTLGISQSFGTLASNLLPMAIGGVWTAAILGGITILGRAWKALSGDIGDTAEAAQKAAQSMKESIDSLVNAGSFAELEKKYRDANIGTRAGNYADGITGLRAERARLSGLRQSALTASRSSGGPAFGSLGVGAGGRVDNDLLHANQLKDQIAEIDKRIAARQDEINALYSAITDPRNSLRGADRTTTPIVTSESRGGPAAAAARRDAAAAARERERLIGLQRNPGLSEDDDRTFLQKGSALLKGAPEHAAKQAAAAMKKLPDSPEWAKALVEAQDRFASGIGDALGGGIAAGVRAAFESGSIGDGFKALGGALLGGLGAQIQQFGEAALATSALMLKIKASLATMNPVAGIAASLGMIALGAALQGAAGRAFGGGSHGGGASSSFVGGGGGGGALPQIIDRGVIGGMPTAGAAGSGATAALSPQTPIVFAPTIIGPNDPAAQKGVVQLLKFARARGMEV